MKSTKFLVVILLCCLSIGCNERKTARSPGATDGPSEIGTPSPLPQNPSPPENHEPLPTPPQELPLCKELCENNTEALRGNRGVLNYLSFMNFGYRGIGRCRGHAIVSQKLAELAQFDPHSNTCMQETLTNECYEKASIAIENILKFHVQKIYGFSNLYDFSSHPQIQELLKMHVRSISHKYSAVRGNIRDESYENEYLNVFYELKTRIEEAQQPYIGVKGVSIGNHALLGYDVRFLGAQEILCVRDSNIIPDRSIGDQCQNYLYHDGESIFYKRDNQEPTRLFIFTLMSDEDERVKKYIQARFDYCVKTSEAKGLCQ